jgi:hypothetical protein
MNPPQICHVPDCGEDARLYPAGWLCAGHKRQTEKEKAK